MKKNILFIGVLLLVCILTTGCKKTVTKLECTKTSSEGVEVYADITTNMKVVFDDKGNRPKNANFEVIIDLSRYPDLTDAKMKLLVESFKKNICGNDELIKEENCEPEVTDKKIIFKTTGRFNDIMINFTGEEKVKDIQKFLEDHESMTCNVTKGEENE